MRFSLPTGRWNSRYLQPDGILPFLTWWNSPLFTQWGSLRFPPGKIFMLFSPYPTPSRNSALIPPDGILPSSHLVGFFPPTSTSWVSILPLPPGGILQYNPPRLMGFYRPPHLTGSYYPSYLIGFSPNSTRWDSAASPPDGILPLALLMGSYPSPPDGILPLALLMGSYPSPPNGILPLALLMGSYPSPPASHLSDEKYKLKEWKEISLL